MQLGNKEGYMGPVLLIYVSNYRVGTKSEKCFMDEKHNVLYFLSFIKITTLKLSLTATSPLQRHAEPLNRNSDSILEITFPLHGQCTEQHLLEAAVVLSCS